MNIILRNKQIVFATHKILAERTIEREGREPRTFNGEAIAFDVEQKDKIVADFEAKGFTVTVEEETPDAEMVEKAKGFKGYTLEQARKYLETTSKDKIIQSMALAIAELHAEVLELKGGLD